MNENYKTIQKKAVSIIWLLFLGALGSGLWEIFLKDFLYYLGNLFVTGVSKIYGGYIDQLYENIGRQTKFFELLPSMMLVLFIAGTPIFGLLWSKAVSYSLNKSKNKKNRNNSEPEKHPRYLYYILESKARRITFILVLTIPISVAYVDILIKGITTYSGHSYLDQTTEILRPYIGNQKYYEIRSKFRQVNDKNKMESLLKEIRQLSSLHNLELPKSKLFGITNE